MTTKTTSNEMPQTSIKIQMSTRDRLVELGKKNESYDTIINKLIDFYQKTQNVKQDQSTFYHTPSQDPRLTDYEKMQKNPRPILYPMIQTDDFTKDLSQSVKTD